VVLAAKTSGKVKMVAQSLIISLFLLAVALNDSGYLSLDAEYWALRGVAVIVIVNVLSLLEYMKEVPCLLATLEARRQREREK
jgi:phosphatidylglycerophosphate synthase